MRVNPACLTALLATLLLGCSGEPPAKDNSASGYPNILLIVADDLGYSDLGIYGSEIETPNLDALAREGVLFSQFYAAPMCSPTRAMLLTGVDHHRAGIGNLVERLADNQRGEPGYEGHLNGRVVTLPETLKAAGYRTFMAGKWHLGKGPNDPTARGFDRALALMESGAGHFANMQPLLGPGLAEYTEDGRTLEALPADFYSSRSYVKQIIDYLDHEGDITQPFFAYLAFTAPHFPLQAPRASIDRYRGRYDAGYDEVLTARLARMRAAGLVANDVKPFPQLRSEPAWGELDDEAQAREARRMEVYAAMIDDMDREVGTLLDALDDRGLRENTIIVFLSDNGAEGHYLRWGLNPLVPWAESCCDDSLEGMGNADSYLMLGPNWARVAATPFRMFKGFTSEGGVRVPAIVNFPERVEGGRRSGALVSVLDVMPTVLELAGIPAPDGDWGGRQVEAMQGQSMVGLLTTEDSPGATEDATLAFEMFGRRGLRQGPWKIVWETDYATWWDADALGIRRNRWQLYNLDRDPTERTDLAAEHPERLKRMIEAWNAYAADNGVILPDRQRGY